MNAQLCEESAGELRQFATTRWSLILSATQSEDAEEKTRQALNELCRTYWRPVFSFVCRRGYSMEDAQDLTQDFFLKILEPAFASGLSSPFDLAFDSAGNLFVTDWGSGGHIYKFTPDGTQSTFAQLVAPEGLAFDSAGNLFVVDEDTGNIFKFTPDGVRSTFAKAVGFSMDEVAFLAFSPTPGPIPAAVRRHRHRHHHH